METHVFNVGKVGDPLIFNLPSVFQLLINPMKGAYLWQTIFHANPEFMLHALVSSSLSVF